MKKLEKIIFGIFLIMYLLLLINQLNRVVLLYPRNDEIITNRQPEFRWTAGYPYYVFLLSDNKNMNNPIVKILLYDNEYRLQQQLGFDPYYWQVIGVDEDGKTIMSRKNTFMVQSLVALETDPNIRNVGNVPLIVEERQGNKLIGHTILDIREIFDINLTNKSDLIAGQYE